MSFECYETIRRSEMRNHLKVKEKCLRFKKPRKQRALSKVENFKSSNYHKVKVKGFELSI